jgi:hypothetical protein
MQGEYNNKVSSYYKDSLPGDSPELMPLDCHLFNDIKEGTCCNVAFSFFLEEHDQRKYALSTPKKAFNAIERSIQADCPSVERIAQDISRIPKTIQRIIDADGTYICDSSHTVLKDNQHEPTVDPIVLAAFYSQVESTKEGKGLPYKFQYTKFTDLESVEIDHETHTKE